MTTATTGVHLQPYRDMAGISFSSTPEQIRRQLGAPSATSRNAVELEEWDYGHLVCRFQDSGRLEEITVRAPVLHLGSLAVPFASLAAWVRQQDTDAFERAGFVVSPRYGLAFVPHQPDWVTALAPHCLDSWRALP